MPESPFAVLDVTDWPPAGEEQLGTKPKQWLAHPATDGRWLWKRSTWNLDRLGNRFRKGDDWAERVACEVGRRLGLPVARVELARRGAAFGIVSERFLDDHEDLIHGNELLPGIADAQDRSGYRLDVVGRALADVGPPKGHDGPLSAMGWFAGYLGLDALLGNTDRHVENWGVVERGDTIRLAPSFDHASCLGFLLSDATRVDHLTTNDRNRSVEAYAARATSKFAGRHHPAVMAVEALRIAGPAAAAHWSAAVRGVPSIDAIVAAVPDDRITPPAARFACALFEVNGRRLSQAFRTLGP